MVHKIPAPIKQGFLNTGAEAENSAVNSAKESVPPLYKNQSSKALTFFTENRERGNRALVIVL